MNHRTPVKELWCDAIHEVPVDFDWSEGFADCWEVVYPDLDHWAAKQCREWLDDRGYDHEHLDDQEEGDYIDDLREIVRERMYESDDYAPVMSYYYPLPNLRMSAERAQVAIDDTNCVVVNIKDEYGDWEIVLALAGGGMDLELGHLRGVHAARLPAPAPLLPPAQVRRLETHCPARLDHRWLQPLLPGRHGPGQIQPPRPPLGSPGSQGQQRRIIQATRIPAFRIGTVRHDPLVGRTLP